MKKTRREFNKTVVGGSVIATAVLAGAETEPEEEQPGKPNDSWKVGEIVPTAPADRTLLARL